MSKEFLKFEVIEIKTQNFHPSESFIAIDNVDIDNILLSDKLAYKKKIEKTRKNGFKNFIGNKNDEKAIIHYASSFQRMSGYVKLQRN